GNRACPGPSPLDGPGRQVPPLDGRPAGFGPPGSQPQRLRAIPQPARPLPILQYRREPTLSFTGGPARNPRLREAGGDQPDDPRGGPDSGQRAFRASLVSVA